MKSLKMNTWKAILAIGNAIFLSMPAAQAADGWLVDFDKAKAQAAKEGKSILMEFTGSDWCPPCINLEQKILKTQRWKDATSGLQKHICDFPITRTLPDEEKAENHRLGKEKP